MRPVPSLFALCARTVGIALIDGNYQFEDIFELPSDLFDFIAANLPPLGLQCLHERLSLVCDRRWLDSRSTSHGRKRERYETFETEWEMLFRERWPEKIKKFKQPNEVWRWDDVEIHESVDHIDDWQQLYWENHLQDCLDEAAERALVPAFDGCIGEQTISDSILKTIGYGCSRNCRYSMLSHHCVKFSHYARHLRLHNVLCVPELCELLMTGKLRSLVFPRIINRSHVDGVCALLEQNRDTLESLEFIHCRLPPTSFSQICRFIFDETETHKIKHFTVKSSNIFESKQSTPPAGLLSFLSSGRSLESLCLTDNRVGPESAKIILDTLAKSCNLVTLEISDNNIAGWLSKLDRRFPQASSILGLNSSLKSLCVFNLRGNNLCKDDAEDLKHVLVHLPNLRSLDISDNPLEDDGIRSLIPYFMMAFKKAQLLSDIKIENCNLSGAGVSELLESVPTLEEPLNSLSLADNDLGSCVAAPLARFLASSRVKVLDIEDIGLGPLGFQEVEKQLPKDMALVCINISKNRGGIESASLISKIILQAPNLVAVNAGYNFMPPEALVVIHDALNQSRGKLQKVVLTGNTQLGQSIYTSKLLEFQFHGKPIVTIPSGVASSSAYDDDP